MKKAKLALKSQSCFYWSHLVMPCMCILLQLCMHIMLQELNVHACIAKFMDLMSLDYLDVCYHRVSRL